MALIAEDLVLLCGTFPDRFAEHVEAQLSGALLTELLIRRRVALHASADMHSTISVTDRGSTGDDLLDAAVALLGATGPPIAPPSVRRRVLGSAARHRLRTRAVVSPSDLVSWWWKAWRVTEFPGLRPTVLRELLAIMEGLGSIHDRVVVRLAERGALHPEPAARRSYVADDALRAQVRERVRRVALGDQPPDEPATAYLAAMCGLRASDTALDAVAATESERAVAMRRAHALFEDDSIADTVWLIADKWETALDWSD